MMKQRRKSPMSKHDNKKPRTKYTLLADILLASAIIILFVIAFHPLGIGKDIYLPEGEIVIAAMLPLEGSLQEFGIGFREGIEMAVADINTGGGVRGIPLRIQYFNNKGDDQLSIALMHEIHEMGIPVLIGAIASTNSVAIAPYAESMQIVMLSPASTASELTAFKNYVYRTVSSDVYQGKGMAQIIASTPDIDAVMIIYQNNVYGHGLLSALVKELEHWMLHAHVVSEVSVEKEVIDIDFIINEMNETKVNGVVLMILPEQGIAVMNAARGAGLTPAWFGSDMMTTSEVPQGVGSYSEHMIGFTQTRRLMVPWVEDRYYQAEDLPKLNFPVGYGYDAVMLLAECTEDEGYTAEGIRNALDNIRYMGINGPRIFDENGDVQPVYDIMIVRDGEWDPLEWNQILRYAAE
jgi:branched-chain amino acid transport system substrate-binding protein